MHSNALFTSGRRGPLRHAGHKRHGRRLGCCNFVNILSIKPNVCRDIEHITLTNFSFCF